MEVEVKATVSQDVYVDPTDVIASIKDILGFKTVYSSHLAVKDGQLVRQRCQISNGYPMSSMYDYKTISNNPKWIELFNSIQCIEDYLNHYDEPQWDKIIKGEV